MQKDRTKNKIWWWRLIGLLLILFYLTFALTDGPHTYADSASYIEMDFAREPMYALFLWVIRLACGSLGGDAALRAAVIVQSLIAAWAALVFARTVSELFSLSRLEDAAVTLCAVFPSLMCRFVANRRMMYSCSILSEALAMPLFLVFFACLLRCVIQGGRQSARDAAFWSLILISVRKQMYITLPLLVLTLLCRGVKEKRFLARLVSALVLSAAVLLGNNLLDRGYNYLLRGEAKPHTGDMRFVTTMLLYNARPGDEQAIADPELRGLYDEIIRTADEHQYLSSYAPADWFGRAGHFSQNYDNIQFACLRDTARPFARAKYGGDETAVSLELDRINNGLNAALLPGGWTRLLRTASDSFFVGLLTTALAFSRRLVPAAVLLYLALLALLVWCIRRRQVRAAEFGLLALAAIAANVGLVSLTIFCQARYTIYNMGIFYTALFLLARAFLRGRKQA